MQYQKVVNSNEVHGSLYAYGPQGGPERAGAFLAFEREARGLSLADVSRETKVRVEHLAAIEATAPSKLPVAAYAVGFVKVYARFLDLDADAIAQQFKADLDALKPKPKVEKTKSHETPRNAEVNATPLSVSALFGVLVFIGWVSGSIIGKSVALAQHEKMAAIAVSENALLESSLAENSIVVAATPQEFPAPEYPSQCTGNAAVKESVTVLFDVNSAGHPSNIRVQHSTNDCFDRAALAALKRWKFSPKTVNGVAQADLGKAARLNFRM